MRDVIVVLPGIMGSTLIDREGNELWGVKPGTLLRSIARLGRNFEQLRLPPEIGDAPAPDGVRAGILIPIPHVIGKLFGTHGYGRLIDWLEQRFDVRQPSHEAPGNLIAFPYDWRLSNRLNAKRIETELVPQLEKWRKANNHPDAKFRFICHSMGGLVARWFTEVMGGRELTRQLITLGTPHRGAAEALIRLANGFEPGFGPIRVPLTEIIRSLPAAHQLLPTYRCVETADGLKRIGEVAIPGIDSALLADAMAFHNTILDNTEPGGASDYTVFALKGIAQPTTSSVRLRNGLIEGLNTMGSRDWGGDGTVPRLSSHPAEWQNDAYAATFGQQHATLQSDSSLLRQLFAILTASQIEAYADAENLVGLDLPGIVGAGEPLRVRVASANGDQGLPLRAHLFDEQGKEFDSRLMRNLGEGHYEVSFDDLVAGQVTVQIASATQAVPLDPVIGLTIAWDQKHGALD